MQIKLFTIPIIGGERIAEDLNAFLCSKKILQVERRLVNQEQGAFWCFCVEYISDQLVQEKGREKVDYRQVLDEASFRRFARLREIRKNVAAEEMAPPYVVFTDKELADLARFDPLTLANMQSVEGIGAKKIEKYGHHFLTAASGETR